jgi:hypothetical protein
MARLVLAFAYLGLLLYVVGAAYAITHLQFVCANAACPSNADPSARLAAQLRQDASAALLGALLLALAWLICLAAHWRADHGWGFFAVLLALPLGLWLASTAALGATDGRPFPATWEAFGTWRSALWAALLMSLIGPLVTILMAHRLLEGADAAKH